MELESSLAVDSAPMVLITLSDLIHAKQRDDVVLNALAKGMLYGHAVCEDED